MLRITSRLVAVIAAISLVFTIQASDHNTLTEAEQSAGWKLLFDGTSYDNWTGMKGSPLPDANWTVEDGTFRTVPGRGRDLVSTRPYENFELSFDVKILAGGNSGVKYMVQPEWLSSGWSPDASPSAKERQRLAAVGYEYQVIDDSTINNKPDWKLGSLGSYYLIYAPDADKKQNPSGEWNSYRILVDGTHVEHWLNGDKILEFELGTKEVLALVRETKFRAAPGYGKKGTGYIVLTHHNSPAWFRNIKIRELN
jgi:hypothetical protein